MMQALMNKTGWAARLCMMLLLVGFMAACTSTRTHESAGEYIDDSVITTSVKTAIYGDPDYKPGQVSVKTYKGVVQLSGFVNSAQAAAKAAELAKGVKGVTSVENSLIVK